MSPRKAPHCPFCGEYLIVKRGKLVCPIGCPEVTQ
jgi:hypothetical protein